MMNRRPPPSRTPLLPKELIVPLCQRLAFVLFAMCSTALGIRLWTLWKMGKLGHGLFNHGIVPGYANGANSTAFFLDIGSGNHGLKGDSMSKKLEETGKWRGVCVDPFPDADRSCESVAMPVTAASGDFVELPDCRGQSSLQVLMSSDDTSLCPTQKMQGVSIVDALKLSKAPRVIDFVSLHTENSALDILKKFPFKDFCVRSWLVHHGSHDGAADTEKLLVDKRCRLRHAVGDDLWARCSCEHFTEETDTESLPHVQATQTPSSAAGTHESIVRSDGALVTQRRKKKGEASPHVPELSLPDKADSPESKTNIARNFWRKHNPYGEEGSLDIPGIPGIPGY